VGARVLIVKNALREGPGLLRDVLQAEHVGADVVELERGEPIPSLDGYGALIVLGGPASAEDATPAVRAVLRSVEEAVSSGLPYLGICLGHQMLAKVAGARVVRGPVHEVGFHDGAGRPYAVRATDAGRDDALLDGIAERFEVFHLHGETVEPSARTEVLLRGEDVGASVQAIRVGRRAYGLQMHVELVPEMLAVWCAQDAMLASSDAGALQRHLGATNAAFAATGRRIFTNFLVLAGLASTVDLTAEPTSVR